MMTKGEFLVIGRNRDGSAYLATRREFADRSDAAQYAAGMAACYHAEIVETLPILIGRPGKDDDE